MEMNYEALFIISLLFLILALINFFTLSYIGRSVYLLTNGGSLNTLSDTYIFKLKPMSSKTKQFYVYKGYGLSSYKAQTFTVLPDEGDIKISIKENDKVYLEDTDLLSGATIKYGNSASNLTPELKEETQHTEGHTVGITFTNTYNVECEIYFYCTQATIASNIPTPY